LLRGQRIKANLPRIAQQGAANGAAKIDVDPTPFSVAVRL